MTLDDALAAYAAGLDTEIACLQQVSALAREQRDAWTRGQLTPLGSLAARRAALMHELSAIETQLAPLRDRLLLEPVRVRQRPGYAAAEARSRDAQALVTWLMDADRSFLIDLETTLEARRREVQQLETGGATLAAYRRVVVPTVASAGLVDRRG